MASLGHVAVGMAAARFHNLPSPSGLRRASQRPSWSSTAAWSALSMLPDVDVIGFLNGVPYEAPWGHRGATHSFTFAIVAGLVVVLVARRLKQPALRTALFATAVIATHPLLDTLTDGGLGAALFWPFDLTRYFAPWRPIQVAPIGLDLFTPYGLIVALSEIVLFLPLFAFALRRTGSGVRDSGFALAGWLVASWLVASSDPWRDATVAFLLRDRTEYASGFSESKFASLVEGQFKPHVREALGAPLEEGWMYAPEGQNRRDLPANQPN